MVCWKNRWKGMGWFAHTLKNRWQTLVSWGLTHEFLWWSLYRLIRVWQGSSTIMESNQSNERQLIYVDQASLTSPFAKPEKWACVRPQVWLALRHTDVCWQIRWMFALVKLGIIIIPASSSNRAIIPKSNVLSFDYNHAPKMAAWRVQFPIFMCETSFW